MRGIHIDAELKCLEPNPSAWFGYSAVPFLRSALNVHSRLVFGKGHRTEVTTAGKAATSQCSFGKSAPKSVATSLGVKWDSKCNVWDSGALGNVGGVHKTVHSRWSAIANWSV